VDAEQVIVGLLRDQDDPRDARRASFSKMNL